MPNLRAPTGRLIVGTSEIIPGCGLIHTAETTRLADGSLSIIYVGETVAREDDQTTKLALGQRVFLDEDGFEWLERELALEGENPTLAEIMED